MKKRGFTYLEVMIALSILAILVIFVIKLDHTANDVMRDETRKMKMLNIAQTAVERYKADMIESTPYATSIDGFYVKIESKEITRTIRGQSIQVNEVKVTVKKNQSDPDGEAVVLFDHDDL